MGYHFFRRLAGRLFATIAILLLTTDYLMFAQWQVNTYRVWHGFVLFAALNCVHGLSEWRRGRWVIATILTYAALFYGELVFAAFVAFTVGFYTIWTYRRTPRFVVLGGLVQGAGATLGLATLIAQLVLYLGWQDFLTDLRLTLTARNYAPDSTEFLAVLKQFYEQRNIVFLYNIQPEERFVGIFASVRLLFRFVLQTPTPFLTLLGLGMAAAALLADSRRPGPRDIATILPSVSIAAIAQLIPGLFVFILAIVDKNAVVGLPLTGIQGEFETIVFVALACFVLAVALAFALSTCARSISVSGTLPGIYRCARANLFFLCFGLLILGQSALYDQTDAILWWKTLTPLPAWTAKVIVCAVAFIGSMLILTGRRALLGRWHDVPSSLGPFFLCGALSYFLVYKLSSGYVFSGYLVRLCPFIVFHVNAFIALGLFIAIAIALTLLGRTDFNNRATKGACAAATAVAIAFVSAWTVVQSRYLHLFPPDRLAFVNLLKDPAFRGRGLISNNYAVPFALAANTWAYIQPNPSALAGGSLLSQNSAPHIDYDYLWLADRRTNASYSKPDIYVCFNSWSTLHSLVAHISTPRAGAFGCSRTPIVDRALSSKTDQSLPNAKVLARDAEDDHWAILRLEWTSSN
jgi:hypothetical protein